MKRFACLVVTLCVVGLISAHAQSRRVAPGKGNDKPNERPVTVAAPTPLPTATPVEEEPRFVADANDDESDVVSVDTQLVKIPVRVIDRKNRFVGGLTK